MKPENVLLNEGGRPLLSDFGIAREVAAPGDGAAAAVRTLAGSGLPVGTPEYMAPEQLRGEVADRRADVYGLGVVLYELLTGRVPHAGATPLEVMARVLTEATPPPSDYNPGIWPELADVVLGAVAPDPDRRYPDMSSLNKPLTDGGAILWAITQSQNEDFLRKLSYHVRKGKKAKAREGYSNGNPMFGYRVPPLALSPEVLAHVGEIRRRRVVYEPHPTYFPALQKLGELLAAEPPRSLSQIADELNLLGYRYWSSQHGERLWSPMAIDGLLYRAYHREFAPDDGHGTIVLPTTGEAVAGLHVAAWPHEQCAGIDANRVLLANNVRARPRRGAIHTFSGLAYCAHCRAPLNVQSSTSRGDRPRGSELRYAYTYYGCSSYERTGRPCAGAADDKRWTLVRADVLEHQFGRILDWLGEWTDEAVAYLREALGDVGGDRADPVETYEQKRTELARRRENVSRQHEMGYLTDAQLAERMAAIVREESQLPVPLRRRHGGTAEELVGLIRSMGDQWRAADKPHQRTLRYQLVSALVRRVYVDLAAHRIVGLHIREDLALPVKRALASRGWGPAGGGEPDVVWNEAPDLPERIAPSHFDRVLEALRDGHGTSAEIGAATGISPYNTVNQILLRMVQQGLATRERVQREGKQYRYTLVARDKSARTRG